MFSLKTLANQLHVQTFKHFGSRSKSVSRKQKPTFDEKYTDVVDRLIKESKIRRQKIQESNGSKKVERQSSDEPNQNVGGMKISKKEDEITGKLSDEPSREVKKIKMNLTKNGDQINGKFSN